MKITRTLTGYVPKGETMAKTLDGGFGGPRTGFNESALKLVKRGLSEQLSDCFDTLKQEPDFPVKRRIRVTLEIENE